jgi:hypothetical protein
VESAVTRALPTAPICVSFASGIDTATCAQKLAGNQRLPDIRANATYQASGLGGTEVMRAGGFPGTIVGPGALTTFGSVLDQLFKSNYPTWAVGISVSYPIGGGVDDANYARARLEVAQAEQRVKSAEARAIQQVRDAAWKVEMNAKRLDTTRAARALAEQRLTPNKSVTRSVCRPVSSSFRRSATSRRPKQTSCRRSSPTISRSWISTRCSKAGPSASGPGSGQCGASVLSTGSGATAPRATSTALALSPLEGGF